MIKSIALFLVLICSINSLGLKRSQAVSSAKAVQVGCIQIFRHCPVGQDYSETICDDKASLSSIDGVSSFVLSEGLTVTFYTGANFTGTAVEYSKNSSCLATEGQYNDKFNSIRLHKVVAKGCVELIRHCPGGDNFSKLYCSDQAQIDDIGGLSGIRFGKDTKAVFYTGKNYSGDKHAIKDNVDCLATSGSLNDKLNSFKFFADNGVKDGCVKLIRHCPQSDNHEEVSCSDRANLDSIGGLSAYVLGFGVNVDFYTGKNYQGDKVHADKDVSCLATSGSYNDKFNSAKISQSFN